MRTLIQTALALLLAARASAAVALDAVDAPPSAAAQAGPAAPHPLSLAANLAGPAPTLAAAAAFLAAPAAQAWLMGNRPQAYAPTVARALRLDDWRRTLTAHDDPRLLREALLARADDPVVNSPAALMGLVDRDPALSAKRRLYAIAALEWDALSQGARDELSAQGRGPRDWAALGLPERYDAVRSALGAIAARMVTAAPGSADYAAQYEAALVRARAVMTDEEIDERAAELARARAVAEGLARAERADARAGGLAAELLAGARGASDLDEAGARVDAALAALGERPLAAGPASAPGLSEAERRELAGKFGADLRAALAKTAVGSRALADLSAEPAGLKIAPTAPGVAASYNPRDAAVTVGERELAGFARALGRSPGELVSDPALRADAALYFAAFFVHELQHHRQFVWARAQGLSNAYSQDWEREAYAAQAAFLRQSRASGPELDALAARLRARGSALAGELELDAEMDRDPASHERWLAGTYRTIPTAPRVAARRIEQALDAAGGDRGAVERALELAGRLLERVRAELGELNALRRAAPAPENR